MIDWSHLLWRVLQGIVWTDPCCDPSVRFAGFYIFRSMTLSYILIAYWRRSCCCFCQHLVCVLFNQLYPIVPRIGGTQIWCASWPPAKVYCRFMTGSPDTWVLLLEYTMTSHHQAVNTSCVQEEHVCDGAVWPECMFDRVYRFYSSRDSLCIWCLSNEAGYRT